MEKEKKKNRIHAAYKYEDSECYIAGLCVVTKDLIAVTDHSNFSVKLIDVGKCSIKSCVKLPTGPRGITKMSEVKVAVAETDKKKLRVFDIEDDILIGCGTVLVGGHCAGVDYDRKTELFAVSCVEPASVKVLKEAGELLYHIDSLKFDEPYHLRFCHSDIDENLIYITDRKSKKITCIKITEDNWTGEYIKPLPGMDFPRDICVKPDGSLLICCQTTETVCQFSNTHDMLDIILDKKRDDIECPIAMAYSEDDGILYVSGIRPGASKDISEYIKVYCIGNNRV